MNYIGSVHDLSADPNSCRRGPVFAVAEPDIQQMVVDLGRSGLEVRVRRRPEFQAPAQRMVWPRDSIRIIYQIQRAIEQAEREGA